MKRREAFKKIGIMALVSSGGLSLLASCSQDKKEITTAAEATVGAEAVPKVKSEREKLIVNRKYNKFKDPNNPTKGELKHTPDIIIGKEDENGFTLITITVGMKNIVHPSTKEHWIDYITLYLNNNQVAHTEFINGGIRGYSTHYLKLNKEDKIRAEAGCNLHGIYDNTITI
jgi:superoxide reductase